MKLNINHMKEGENTYLFDSREHAWLSDVIKQVSEKGYTLKSPLFVKLNFTKLEPEYYLKGQIQFSIDQTCARCTEPFDFAVNHQFDIALAHTSHNHSIKIDKIEPENNELDIHFFDEFEIELNPILVEQFVLSIPYQVVCKNDCKGLCQFCGRNLNENDCNCATQNVSSPFSILKEIKI
jgi:uncharacterized protein